MKKNSEFYFQNRDCRFFPCHRLAEDRLLNCLFCYCPLYALGDQCGGDFVYTETGVKSCAGCMIPHTAHGYDHVMSRISQIVEMSRRTTADKD